MIEISELCLPDDAEDPGWVAYTGMMARSSAEAVGTSGTAITPAEMLTQAQQGRSRLVRRWLARLDGEPVGLARLVVDLADDPTGGTVLVHVEPGYRGQGIGTELSRAMRHALPETTDHLAAEVMTPVPTGGEVIEAPSGGAVAADHPGVRLALRHGFCLAQTVWFQRLDLTTSAQHWELAGRASHAVAGADHEVRTFEGVPPEELRAGIAVLKARMSTDAPHGEMIQPESQWDANRVVQHYEALSATSRVLLAIVLHAVTGEVVALNELISSRRRPDAPLQQKDTLVLPKHRGHRLGRLVKAANLVAARAAVPEATSVLTFNAHENQHMLAINDELGFERRGVLGLFQVRSGADGGDP